MTDIINLPSPEPTVVALTFAWSPSSTYTFTAPNGVTIASPRAAHATNLTFTASVTIENQGNDISGLLTIIEYAWDFGDGILGYGNPVHHTYVLANLQAATKLQVTDSKGRKWFARAQMYLS